MDALEEQLRIRALEPTAGVVMEGYTVVPIFKADLEVLGLDIEETKGDAGIGVPP